jgi:hypothetical protein
MSVFGSIRSALCDEPPSKQRSNAGSRKCRAALNGCRTARPAPQSRPVLYDERSLSKTPCPYRQNQCSPPMSAAERELVMTEDSRWHKRQLSHENLGGAADLAERKRLFLGAVQESDAADGNELSSDSKTDIADCFLRLADLPTSALDRLSRYEHMLWRQARQIVFTLESLRRRKRQPSRSTFPFWFQRRELGALSEEFR